MEKYRLKKIKMTIFEKALLVTMIFLLCGLYLIFPLQTSNSYFKHEIKTVESVMTKLKFKDDFVSQKIFNRKYLNVVYETNKKYNSRFINYETEEEIDINDLVKEDYLNDFNDKITKLLYLKYPRHIADVLNQKSNKEYVLHDNKMIIYYYDEDKILKSDKEYFLTINYNEIYEYLDFTVTLDLTYENEDGHKYDPNKVSVAFTFDDGPSGNKTLEILSYLEDYKMGATFFVLGSKIESNADVIKKVFNSHSEVGYHSFNHASFTSQTNETILNEFNISNNFFKKVTGGDLKLTRPPYGNYNAYTLKAIDQAFIRWNVDTNDWRYKDTDYIVKHVLSSISDGDIILFHDTYDTTVGAIKRLLPLLYEKEVQVVSISDLAALKGYTLNNHEVYFDFHK